MSDGLLRLDGLACQRGERILWRGVSAILHAGELLAISGANGVGKTSLLRIIAGLLPPLAGTVSLPGRLSLVDDSLALDRDLPLIRALGFWARIDGASPDAIIPVLERLDIAQLADIPVRYFSTGQRRRAAIARLLIADVPLWLLDEPANGLDRNGTALLEHLIADHRLTGGMVVLASHQSLALDDHALLDLTAHQQ